MEQDLIKVPGKLRIEKKEKDRRGENPVLKNKMKKALALKNWHRIVLRWRFK